MCMFIHFVLNVREKGIYLAKTRARLMPYFIQLKFFEEDGQAFLVMHSIVHCIGSNIVIKGHYSNNKSSSTLHKCHCRNTF
jgi:hypothetical protein